MKPRITLRGIGATFFANCIFIFGVHAEWVGRKCCDHAISDECRMTCLSAKSKENLIFKCREPMEVDLYACIFRHQRKKKCCSKAENMTSSCQQVCSVAFRASSGPSTQHISDVEQHCPAEVYLCTKNYSDSFRKTSNEGLLCCDKSLTDECRADCREVMKSSMSDREKIDELVKMCGNPVPREPLWRCLLSKGGESPRATPPRVTADLHCCTKAVSANCKELCTELYTKPWESSTNWQYFRRVCEYSPDESDLNICLQEVREPCKMGCDNMNFCTNFNNRPTELFHSCNARSDSIARSQMSQWSQGLIRLPFVDIPVTDIRRCSPEKWKAVACSLEIKPCSANAGHSTICRNDCVNLLRECADQSRFKPGVTIEGLCDRFSPPDLQHGCIALDRYTAESDRLSDLTEITQPCNPNPCGSGHLCVINRDFCPGGQRCPAFKCLPGCKVGDVDDFLVHIGQRVRIPDWDRGEGCYRACACTTSGRLHHCTDLPCMDAPRSCNVVGQIKVHGSQFRMDCNFCSCYNGNVTCTKRQCSSKDLNDDSRKKYTGLPCNCEQDFVPACAANGRTYPNTCLARCMGHKVSHIGFGPCEAKDPCNPNPCTKRNERCMKASRVCVTSSNVYSCPQYECIPPYGRCLNRRRTHDVYANDGYFYINQKRSNSARRSYNSPMLFGYDVDANRSDPVCDTDGVEYETICHLRRKQRRLAYRGHCDTNCDHTEKNKVCGQNIVTYDSKCAALAERVLIDYEAPCRTVNVKSDHLKSNNCEDVNCTPLTNSKCNSVVPPGACCAVCGGMLRVLFSQSHIDAVSKSTTQGPITVRDIIRALRHHISVKQCDIFGHLSIEGDIVILAVPVVSQPTLIQIEACLREAEGLARLINERNPVLTSDVTLSTLTAAEVHGSEAPTGGSEALSPRPLTIYLWTIAFFLVHRMAFDKLLNPAG